LQRTFREEFYDCGTAPPYVADLAAELAAYEIVYNTIRPHQALDYLPPTSTLTNIRRQRDRCNASPEPIQILDNASPGALTC